MRLLDTNVFIRAITDDHPRQSEAARDLFRKFEAGEDEGLVLDAVVAEVVYVLTSRTLYGFSREEARARLLYLLSLPGTVLENRSRCLRALDLFVQQRRLSFVDALVAVWAMDQAPCEVYSFDQGFDRVDGVTRVEPAILP